MPYVLKNKYLKIIIESPLEGYNSSRFDWTGKIVRVKFKEIYLSGAELLNSPNPNHFGKGFYNEFGIENALGFKEAAIGGWFHKIGIGSLKKEHHKYSFQRAHEIQPAKFEIQATSQSVMIQCKSALLNGYAYVLKKSIVIAENSFRIDYTLDNTGQKDIKTDEYAHNFIAINDDRIGSNYELQLPFQLYRERFLETVNPEQKVDITKNKFVFNDTIKKEFFFSNLTGGTLQKAQWNLMNSTQKIGIRETGNFNTAKVNLWGCQHVISPELFVTIELKPGEVKKWFREYRIFELE